MRAILGADPQTGPGEGRYGGVEADPGEPDNAGQTEVINGIAAAPLKETEPERPPRRWGCLSLSTLLLAVWVAGGYYLWQSAMKAPPGEGSGLDIEIIPGSRESSIVEDGDDDKPSWLPGP